MRCLYVCSEWFAPDQLQRFGNVDVVLNVVPNLLDEIVGHLVCDNLPAGGEQVVEILS
jgi:hypothetical protein